MKKLLLILILFLSVYVIYNESIDNSINYLVLGNDLSLIENNYSGYVKKYLSSKYKINNYNTSFVDKDIRISDMINWIKHNNFVYIDGKNVSINQLLKNADVITISIGMNELYYKLSINNENIYSYLNDMVSELEELFSLINRYNHKKVFVMNYYNITNYNKDIFSYLNYYLKNICDKENFIYVEIDKILNNNIIFYEKSSNFYLNRLGNKKISQIIVENF